MFEKVTNWKDFWIAWIPLEQKERNKLGPSAWMVIYDSAMKKIQREVILQEPVSYLV